MGRPASPKCPECGAKINKDDTFCESCGKKLKEEVKEVKEENNVQKTITKLKNILKTADIISIILLVAGLALFIIGLSYSVPDREFSFYFIKEYVGGDAYNGIIEASIRGGEIAGSMISKAVYTTGGIILAALGLNRINK